MDNATDLVKLLGCHATKVNNENKYCQKLPKFLRAQFSLFSLFSLYSSSA